MAMEITHNATRRLQRSLNALGRGTGVRRLKVDGRLGRRTVAATIRFLAAREAEGEAALVRAIAALD
jgi:lysozyme family protein